MDLPEKGTFTKMVRTKLDELDRNQVELANEINVGPSILNRDINDKKELPYKRAREMYEVLREWEDEQRQPATELMSETIVSITLQETRKEAADRMRKTTFPNCLSARRKTGKLSV